MSRKRFTVNERRFVFSKFNNTCQACGKKGLKMKTGDMVVKGVLDHVIPLNKGGYDGLSNIQLLCSPCNTAKRDMSMEEFLVVNEHRMSLNEIEMVLNDSGLVDSHLFKKVRDRVNPVELNSVLRPLFDKAFREEDN